MAWPSSFDFVWKKLIAKPLVYWLLWCFLGLAVLWSYQSQQWSSSKLVSEAVRYWEQQLPVIFEQMEDWKQNPDAVQGAWDEVSWDQDGCRTYWKGNDLSSRDDKVFQNLKEDAWVKVLSGSGLVFVQDSPHGRRVAFVRLEYRYGLTTGTMPFGMLVPFDGGDKLYIVPPSQTMDGQSVRWEGKVWFRVQAAGRHQVFQRSKQWIFHGLLGCWLMLWALLVRGYHRKRWVASSMWILGALVGNLWLWGSEFGGSRFFELVQGVDWCLWSQAGILFNVLWIALFIKVFVLPLHKVDSKEPTSSRNIINLLGAWGAWSGLYLAWVLILDAGQVKIGWANPMNWSWDDAAWVLSLMILMVLVLNLMQRIELFRDGDKRPLVLGILGMILVVLWGFGAGWTLWGWLLGLGYGAWLGIGYLWKRFSQGSSGKNLVLGLMGIFCSILIYGQHWRIQVSSAQGQLTTLVEPRPLEAYTYFIPFIDSLRDDAAWLDSSSLPVVDLSRVILDKHYSNLNPFFDLLSSDLILNTLDSIIPVNPSNSELVSAWKGSVQEFQIKGRNAYRLRIAVGISKPVPDTLVVILAQKFFPSFSPIPSILGTGTSWSSFPGRTGLALYEKGSLIFQSGAYPYPFLLPEPWLNSYVLGILSGESVISWFSVWQKTSFMGHKRNQLNPWSWMLSRDGRPVLIFRIEKNQVAVMVLEKPSLMMPLALGALMTMLMWWMLRLPKGNSRNNFWGSMQWKTFRFQTKVQWATTFLVILVIAALVGFTIFFITAQYRNESQASLLAQLRQFHLMSQDLVSAEGALTDNLVRAMKDRAALNDIDFFLYDVDGQFRSGSRALWFERALVSDYMPFTLWKSFGEGQFQFQLIEERIGQVDYLSAYHTLRNPQGHLIGFVNLPFVNKAPRGAPELNEYLAGVISVFALVLILSILMAYRLAKGVAFPIQVLTKALLQAKIGRKITLDEQMSGGEFGLLLKSYNQMVQSLTENEKRLAEAERNTAWKEMARQIAHDIKNPLTPMKLRIQKLLRDYKENSEVFDAKFESDAKSVLQQIDLLTEIANTYRDFSRESEADKSPIIWSNLIQEVAGWFSEQCVLKWFVEPQAATARIHGHPNRLQRVLQNLLQNSVQAKLDDADKAHVNIKLSLVRDEIVLELVDQGTGISDEMQGRLFELNFTTRSKGLGLGLAMSRKIVEQHGGSLRLGYSDERGTAFIWAMPLYDPNSERSVS